MRVSLEQLHQAWDAVKRGGKSAGPDGIGRTQLADRLDVALTGLRERLARGDWRHSPYRTVSIPKPGGGTRTLAIANVLDRIVQRVLLNRLMPKLETLAHEASFAYRPGRCYLDAIRTVNRYRDAGFTCVFHADVKQCFDSIQLWLAEEMLEELGPPAEVLELVAMSIGAPYLPDLSARTIGLPQGAVLSPNLCNLVLTHLDREVSRKHVRLVRYADDFVIMAKSARRCEWARDLAAHALWQLGLELNNRKSGIGDFRKGFRFLGANFAEGFTVIEKPPYQKMAGRGPWRRSGGRRRERLPWLL